MLSLLLRGLGILLVLAWLSSYFWRAWRRRWLLSKIPMAKVDNWLLGNMPTFTSEQVHKHLSELANELGPIYRFRILHLENVVLSDPKDFLPVLLKGDSFLDKYSLLYRPLELTGEGQGATILTALTESEQWRSVRKAIAPAFSVGNLRRMFPSLLNFCTELADKLESLPPGQAVDMADVAKRITSQVIESLISGKDLGAVSFEPDPSLQVVADSLKAISNFLMDPTLRYRIWEEKYKWSVEKVKLQQEVNRVQMKKLLASNPPPHSIAACLQSLRLPSSGRGLTPTEFNRELALVRTAGFETTAYAITWAMYLVAAHPLVEERIVAELSAHQLLGCTSGPFPRPLTWQDLGELTYLNAVVKESLRLLPPAPLGTTRLTKEETSIAGYTVPAGVGLMIMPYVCHHNRCLFGEDADKFIPERWLPKGDGVPGGDLGTLCEPGVLGGGATLSMSDVYTFSTGPRDCVGQTLAKLELQVVLTSLWSRFHFELAPEMGGVPGVEEAIVTRVTLQSTKGMKMLCHPR